MREYKFWNDLSSNSLIRLSSRKSFSSPGSALKVPVLTSEIPFFVK